MSCILLLASSESSDKVVSSSRFKLPTCAHAGESSPSGCQWALVRAPALSSTGLSVSALAAVRAPDACTAASTAVFLKVGVVQHFTCAVTRQRLFHGVPSTFCVVCVHAHVANEVNAVIHHLVYMSFNQRTVCL